MFNFATRDYNLLRVTAGQARNMAVVQRFSNVESDYNSVIYNFGTCRCIIKKWTLTGTFGHVINHGT